MPGIAVGVRVARSGRSLGRGGHTKSKGWWQMLSVTKPALKRLSRRLVRKGAADGMALRFKRREGGWTLRVEHESPGDTAFSHDGRTVLLLDAEVSKAMADMTLYARKVGQRSQLKLRRTERRGD